MHRTTGKPVQLHDSSMQSIFSKEYSMTHAEFLSLLILLCLYIVIGNLDFNDAVALERSQTHTTYPLCSLAPATSSSHSMRMASVESGWLNGQLPVQATYHRSTPIDERNCHVYRSE